MSSDKRRRKPVNTAPKSAKRFQVPRACQRCKSLRRGCEERRPCSRCVRAGAADDCVQAGPSHIDPSQKPSSPSGPEWAHVAAVAGSPALVAECAALFFEHCFPTIPILTPEYISRLQQNAAADSGPPEASVLLVALCAYVLLHDEGGREEDRPEDGFGVETEGGAKGHGLFRDGARLGFCYEARFGVIAAILVMLVVLGALHLDVRG
ncbi:RING-4 like protein [Metarhizium guizhouense ARSEF 977]|uniref:RING-4 like protein n=1 Tax=Metarhizium guizhouense (strain ARSEF 977) TaxID=1276136 RepID=A0A0B4GHV2_METGA|nr:RING-4 like protein [Metarhizium guizhouense ARSEF 977]